MKRVIVTINRLYGSGGKTIGYMLADALGIPCYSREILQRASEESGINESLFNKTDERLRRTPKFLLSKNIYSGELLPPESSDFTSDQNLFNYEADIIKKYAEEGSCVLIGRCADFVLKEHPDMVSVFIHAEHEFLMEQALERVSMSPKEMERYIERINKYRSDYYRYYTGREWEDAGNYDLCIDSGKIGFEKTVDVIKAYLEVRNSQV